MPSGFVPLLLHRDARLNLPGGICGNIAFDEELLGCHREASLWMHMREYSSIRAAEDGVSEHAHIRLDQSSLPVGRNQFEMERRVNHFDSLPRILPDHSVPAP